MKKLFILFAVALTATFCKKNELGGKAEISGKIAHHDKAVAGATVYIKFDAREFPGRDSTLYDAHVVADEAGGFSFKVFKGDYYLYATGLDYQPHAVYVNGGIPVKTRNREKVEVTVAVSDEH